MTYTFGEFSLLMTRAGVPTRNGTHSRHAYQNYIDSGVVWSIWFYWFRRNGV